MNNKLILKIIPFLLIIISLIAGYLFIKNSQNTNKIQVSDTTDQSAKASSLIEQSSSLGYFKKVSNSPVTLENQPYFLYVGAQFCPFCAAERWSIVKALSRFGTWSDLGPDTSADEEAGFSRIPTYSFVGAGYESKYITFGHKEIADRLGRPIPGQELTAFEQKWFNQYDPTGGVPFLFIGGKYVQIASGYSPNLLAGKTFAEVKKSLDANENSQLIQAINQEADILTAYLCESTNNEPKDVCTKPEISQLASQIQ